MEKRKRPKPSKAKDYPGLALLVPIGSNTREKNGVATIHSDGRFEFRPREEDRPGRKTPRFGELGIQCPLPELYAHWDPKFEPSPTFGALSPLAAYRSMADSLRKGETPLLIFAGALNYSGPAEKRSPWIIQDLGYYIVGFFWVETVRFPDANGRLDWSGHTHNAHYLRPQHDAGNVKALIGGGEGSRLFRKAYPISDASGPEWIPSAWFERHFIPAEKTSTRRSGGRAEVFQNREGTQPSAILDQLFQHESRD